MKITLAQALKEKKRLAGEITNMWNLVQRENSCWENHTRCIDIRETLETIGTYTEKLVELKTKIGKADDCVTAVWLIKAADKIFGIAVKIATDKDCRRGRLFLQFTEPFSKKAFLPVSPDFSFCFSARF